MRRTGKFQRLLASLAMLAWVTTATRGDEPDPLQTALEKPILETGQGLKEIRAFIEPRIKTLSPPADRAAWQKAAAVARREMFDKVLFRGPAAQWRAAKCRVEWLDTIDGGPGYRIRKFRYEALPGMWIPGLLYLPDKLAGRVPVAIHVNGHVPEGKAVGYKQLRSINLAKRGMLVLNVEWFGMGQLRTSGFAHGRLNQLDLCGASGLAPFYLALERVVDVAESLEHADPGRIVVSGLSGGGWQTILIGALDERVALANPVAGYGDFRTNLLFDDMGDSEQSPAFMAVIADYSLLTAMRAPRPTLLTYNASDDCCFRADHTLEPITRAARPVFALYDAEDKLRSHVNRVPGTHNFEQENREALYALISDYFYANDKSFVRAEIPSEAELKTADELNVPLPPDNVDFHTLALNLLKTLPDYVPTAADRLAAENWQREKRDELQVQLNMPGEFDATCSLGATSRVADCQTRPMLFKIAASWSVPAVEVSRPPTPRGKTAIVVADAGRRSLGEIISKHAMDGFRVLAVDPLFFGESRIGAQDPDYTYALSLGAVGQQALAIQAAQLAAIARWARGDEPRHQIKIISQGPRSSMAVLLAAAITPGCITDVELHDALASFKELIEKDIAVESMPELFPFGQLRGYDVATLVALAAPRPVVFHNPSDRAKRELRPLESWYALFGEPFNPAP